MSLHKLYLQVLIVDFKTIDCLALFLVSSFSKRPIILVYLIYFMGGMIYELAVCITLSLADRVISLGHFLFDLSLNF